MACFHPAPLEFPSAPLQHAGEFRVLVDSDALARLGAARDWSGSIGAANHSDRSSPQPSQSPEPRAVLPSRKCLALVGWFSWRRFALRESSDLGPLKRLEPVPSQYRGPDSMTRLMLRTT